MPLPTSASPVIEALLRRSGRGVKRINTRSSSIADALRRYSGSAGNIYANAQGAEKAIGSAVSGSLTGVGQQLGAEISGKLQGIQAPGQAISEFAGGAQTMGAQSGAAAGALSSAELARLQGYGSAEEVYASALPRLAELAGAQERRGFLEQMGQDLTDRMAELSVQQERDMREQQRYDQGRQDDLDQERYERGQDRLSRRDAMRKEKIERSRYRQESKRQKKLDTLATRAAEQEYGLKTKDAALDRAKTIHDMTDDAIDNQLAQGRLTESKRAALERERLARQKEANDQKDGGDGGKKAEYLDKLRDDAFRRAATYSKSKSATLSRNRIDRGTARSRLWAEFGTLLTDRGYKRDSVKTMIERALNAAGY